MEPIQNRRLRYPRVGQNRAQTCTTVGESGHLGDIGPARRFQDPLDQRGNVGLRLRAYPSRRVTGRQTLGEACILRGGATYWDRFLATAAKAWRLPVSVSTLPTRTSKWRS